MNDSTPNDSPFESPYRLSVDAWGELTAKHPAGAPRALRTRTAPDGNAPPGAWALALSRVGRLGAALGDGKHALLCIRDNGHTTPPPDGDAAHAGGSCVLFPPGDDNPWGWPHCSHGGCQSLTIKDWIEAVGHTVWVQACRDAAETPKATEPSTESPAIDGEVPGETSSPPSPCRVTSDDVEDIVNEGATGDVPDTWRALLTLDDKHRPRHTPHNVAVILGNHTDWRGALAYDVRADRIVWVKEPPFDPDYACARGGLPREVTDRDVVSVAFWFERHESLRPGTDAVGAGVDLVASRRAIDPVRDYLDALVWDGTERLATWLPTYLGAEDTPLHCAIGRAWLIAAVARTYRPGCQADYCLVLEGEQGVRKSSALRALFSDPWFSDQLPDIGSKEAGIHLQGPWCVEIAELDALRRAEVTAIKAWVSRRIDRYRGVFAKRADDHARRVVFAGSTNEDKYLRDPTGGRRWWPVRVGGVDLEALARDRDQLWAEAVAAYKAEEPWYLTDATLQAQVAEAQAARREVDPWHDRIVEALTSALAEKCEWVTTAGLLTAACLKPAGQWTKADEMRVADVLRALRWVRRREMVAGNRAYRFYPPASP